MEHLTRDQKEYRLHVAVVEHLHSAFPQVLFLHPANRPSGDTEESRKANAFFNKKMGVKAGAADLLLWWSHTMQPYSTQCGAIELKGDGPQSSKQKTFEFSFTRIGGRYAVCKSVAQVHKALIGWGIKSLHNGIKEPKASDAEYEAARLKWKL